MVVAEALWYIGIVGIILILLFSFIAMPLRIKDIRDEARKQTAIQERQLDAVLSMREMQKAQLQVFREEAEIAKERNRRGRVVEV